MKYVSVSHLVSHTANMLLLINENKIKKYKPWAGSIQSMLSQPISVISSLILFLHLLLALSGVLFPSYFFTETCMHISYPPCVPHAPHILLYWFNQPHNICEKYKTPSSSLCIFLQSPVAASLLLNYSNVHTIITFFCNIRCSIFVLFCIFLIP